jgi:hypothetical protein
MERAFELPSKFMSFFVHSFVFANKLTSNTE